MTIRYSYSTGNFYPHYIEYPHLPDDLIEVDEEDYAAAMGELKLAYLHMVEGTPAEQDGIRAIRARFDGFYVACGGYDRQRALDAVASGHADAVAFATLYISNPDLVERLRRDAPLAEPDRDTFYQGGARGYADYPPLRLAA